MTIRITEKILDSKVDELNRLLNRPLTAYTKNRGTGVTANIGNIHVSHAYGGVELHEIMNESGGVNVLSRGGYISKRALYDQVSAMVIGARLSQQEGETK